MRQSRFAGPRRGLLLALLLPLSMLVGCSGESEGPELTAKAKVAAITPGISDRMGIDRTRARLQNIGHQLDAYFGAHGQSYPSAGEGLAAIDSLSASDRLDYWGRPFAYSVAGAGYRVVSGGPDGELGGDDDLVLDESGDVFLRRDR